jgi:hypothetical protein
LEDHTVVAGEEVDIALAEVHRTAAVVGEVLRIVLEEALHTGRAVERRIGLEVELRTVLAEAAAGPTAAEVEGHHIGPAEVERHTG